MRVIFALILVVNTLFSSSTSTILSIDNDIATIDSIDLPAGKSGIVVRGFKNHQIIISYATIINNTSFRLTPYTNLKQDSFPTFDTQAQVGDRVEWGIYDDRVMIIAPSKLIYKEIKSQTDKEIIHPDILAVYLSNSGTLNPKDNDFKKLCQDYSIGVIKFAIDSKLYDVDCISMQVTKTEDIVYNRPKTSKIPFYNRFKKIKKGFFNFDKEITDFDSYYKKLLNKN